MIVRPALASEAAALAAVHASAFEASWDAASIAALLGAPTVLGLVVESDASISALVLCRLAADEAEILTLATHPGDRRRGMALGLLETAAQTARQRGARAIFLEVGADNLAARALYEKAGFRAVGSRGGYYERLGGALDAMVMRRDLNRRVG